MSLPSKWPLPDRGVRFLTPAFMLEKLSRHPLTKDCYPTALGYYPKAEGHRMERQRHDDNLLLYCVEGHGQLETANFSGPVTPGSAILLPQGLPHAYASDPREPWSIYWAHFQGAHTRVFLEYLGYRDDTPLVQAGLSPALSSSFQSMLSVHRTGYSTRALINAANQLRHLFSQMAIEIQDHQARSHQAMDLEAIQGFMQNNIDQPVDLDTLAATANLSKFHFSTRYKKLTGYSPIKHFLNMKMEYACQLLDSSDMSVKAIAGQLGYEDPLYFSRLFSRTVGLSPRAYRASVRQ